MNQSNPRVVVVGAGIGGLTTAATLSKLGFNTTLLEAHINPGGCAANFYHQKYIFEAGATLSGGFYPNGPMDKVRQAAGIKDWPDSKIIEPTMVVHLPNGNSIPLFGSDQRWKTRVSFFFERIFRILEMARKYSGYYVGDRTSITGLASRIF